MPTSRLRSLSRNDCTGWKRVVHDLGHLVRTRFKTAACNLDLKSLTMLIAGAWESRYVTDYVSLDLIGRVFDLLTTLEFCKPVD